MVLAGYAEGLMTVTLSIWLLPITATILVWLAAAYYRAVDYAGDNWGIGRAFDALVRMVLGGFATLAVWLVFFIVMWWRS